MHIMDGLSTSFLKKYLLTLLCGYGAGDETNQYDKTNTATIPI